METYPGNRQQQLPNATTVLVLGILSLVFTCGIGLILAIIGLMASREGRRLYDENPGLYIGYGSLNAGRIMCIIGICLNSLAILYIVLWITIISAIVGAAGGWSGIFN
jgi:hypothetical protein